MLTAPFRPDHASNRMRDEGDVQKARAYYYGAASENLKFLVRERFAWMNRFIPEGAAGVELGCGAGLSREFIRAGTFLQTDYAAHDFLDVKNVDALATPFEDASFDFVVVSNVIHHLPHPLQFFDEAARILRPGGRLLIHDVHASLLFRLVLRAMRHEGYSFDVDPFDRAAICTDPEDLWSGNNALSRLLFDDREKFQARVPAFEIEYDEFVECLSFLNSGGVTAKTMYVPLSKPLLAAVGAVDRALVKAAPNLFALGRRLALKRITSPTSAGAPWSSTERR